MRRVYSGDQGRKKIRMVIICLAERDSLLFRLEDIKCPVHWYHGTDDPVFSTTIPKEHFRLLKGSDNIKLVLLANGSHFLSASHPKEIEEAILEMVTE
ncbi:hypothetical protein F5Y13DRAFT_170605 [Hypoxylon sp. FL1857]|nr:hypothetical protein F5Y13DRAFT_170605 [Hypoxylon sp. FL1857]